MAKEILDVIVKLGYEGKQNARDAKKDIEGVGKASGGAALDFEAMAAAASFSMVALAALGGVAVFTYDQIRKGDTILNTQKDFEALTGAIGGTADELLGPLREATQGTVSDVDLMKKANELMVAGLVKTPEELIALMLVVDGLNLSMSDAAALMKENSEEGSTALADATAKALLLAPALDDTDAALGRVDTAMANVKDSFALGAREGFDPVLEKTDALIIKLGGVGGLNQFVTDLGTGFVQGLVPGLLQYNSLAEQGVGPTDNMTLAMAGLTGPLGAAVSLWQALNEQVREWNGGAAPAAKGGKSDAPYYPPNPGGGDYDFAIGTPSHPGGWSSVGEYGPERMFVPAGSRVTSTNVTHNQTQNMNLTNSRSVERIVSSYFRNRARGRRIL